MTRPNMFETPIMLNTQLVWPFKGSDWMNNHLLIMVKGSYVLGYRAFQNSETWKNVLNHAYHGQASKLGGSIRTKCVVRARPDVD